MSCKGQIVLPAAIRRADGIVPGQRLEIERLERGDYRLRRIEAAPNEGLVDWLRDCPPGGLHMAGPWPEETTDDLSPPIG